MRLLLTDLKMTVLNRSPENVQRTRRTLHEINAYLQVADMGQRRLHASIREETLLQEDSLNTAV